MRNASRFLLAGLLPVALVAARPVDEVRSDALFRDAKAHLAARTARLGLDVNHAFAAKNIHADEQGDHVRVNQLYKGVRVFEGEAIVHLRNGRVNELTNGLVRGLNLNVTPSLGKTEALAAAHAALAPVGPYAHDPKAELVVATIDGKAALVYHVHTELENGAQETRHTDYFVDAHTGQIRESWSTLQTAAATGTGNSQFNGTISLNTNSVTGGYEMRDLVRSMNFDTRDLNHATSGNGTTYVDADNVWGDGANYNGGSTTSANGQTAALDAHYGVGLTADYYMNVLGRNGIDGNGTATYSRVHYSSAYDNAFWSDSCFCMTYGDGSSFKSLESIDVAGHEMSHGVCARTANLTYRGESGGLNEANSDINGTMVEFMAHGGGTTTVPNADASIGSMSVYWTGTTTTSPSTTKSVPAANYYIGEQLATSKYTRPLRFMHKPSLDGSSPDAWSKTLGRLDVHYSSGVANHFFFLLSHGSQVDRFSDNIQSPMANGVTSITGIGNDLAAKIWYKALSTYMTSSTNYAGAKTATLSACTALGYPAGSTVYNTVVNAWKAVNVL